MDNVPIQPIVASNCKRGSAAGGDQTAKDALDFLSALKPTPGLTPRFHKRLSSESASIVHAEVPHLAGQAAAVDAQLARNEAKLEAEVLELRRKNRTLTSTLAKIQLAQRRGGGEGAAFEVGGAGKKKVAPTKATASPGRRNLPPPPPSASAARPSTAPSANGRRANIASRSASRTPSSPQMSSNPVEVAAPAVLKSTKRTGRGREGRRRSLPKGPPAIESTALAPLELDGSSLATTPGRRPASNRLFSTEDMGALDLALHIGT